MTCDDIRELIPFYAGEELEENERVALESHLGQCSACTREGSDYREIRALLSGLKEIEAPPDTYSTLWNRIEGEFFEKKRASIKLFPIFAYAAVLLIGISLGYLFFPNSSSEDLPQREETVRTSPVSLEDAFRAYGAPQVEPTGNPLAPVQVHERYYLPQVQTLRYDGEVDF